MMMRLILPDTTSDAVPDVVYLCPVSGTNNNNLLAQVQLGTRQGLQFSQSGSLLVLVQHSQQDEQRTKTVNPSITKSLYLFVTYVFLESSISAISSLCWAFMALKMSTRTLKSGIRVASFSITVDIILASQVFLQSNNTTKSQTQPNVHTQCSVFTRTWSACELLQLHHYYYSHTDTDFYYQFISLLLKLIHNLIHTLNNRQWSVIMSWSRTQEIDVSHNLPKSPDPH